jgi:hypothetical protein
MSAGGTRVDVIDASVSRDLVLDPAAYKEAVADPAPTIDPKKN